MSTRRVLKRVLKWTLYSLAFVVLLSIGLRIYSAWQIPKAKSLLLATSDLRPEQVVDNRVIQLLRAHHFKKISKACTFEECWYLANVYSAWPFETRGKALDAFEWLLRHGAENLGFRPWSAGTTVLIRNGQIEEIHPALVFLNDGYRVGGDLNSSRRMRFPDEASPNLVVWEYPRFRELLPQLNYTALTPGEMLRPAFETSFACIWTLLPCQSGYQVFPHWRQLYSEIRRLETIQESAPNPCPSSRMYTRIRDSDQVALGTVLDDGPVQIYLRIDVIRDDSQFPSKLNDTHPRSDFDSRLFRDNLNVGARVIITSGRECNLLPATKENLEALTDALKRYPPRVRDPRRFYSPYFGSEFVTISPSEEPAELRSFQ